MREQLRRAYPQTPASFDARMRQTLASLPAHSSRRWSAVLAAALAAVLMASGLAMAVTRSSLLDRIFRGGAPTPQAEQLVAQVGAAVEHQGVSLTIDEYLLDGADLYVNWTVRSERDEPLMLMFSDLRTELEADASYDDNFAHWSIGAGVLLDAEHPTYSTVSRLHFEEQAPVESFLAGLTVSMLRPMVEIEDRMDDAAFEDEPRLMRLDTDEGVALWPASSFDPESGSLSCEELYAAGEPYSYDGMLAALARTGYAEEVLRLPVQFKVAPRVDWMVHTRIVGQSTFEFDRFTLIVERADFTAAGAHIRCRMIPKGQPAASSLAAKLWFDVLPNGQRVENAYMQSKSIEGNEVICRVEALACGEIPTFIRLIPYDESDRQYPEYAVDLPLAN